MRLTEEEVDLIKSEIDKSNIKNQALKDDLLDHFCCFVESRITHGTSFEQGLQDSFAEICPNGLDEIQTEIIYLLNYKSNLIMKKVMYAVGLAASIAMSIGFLFKILNWPGGNNIFIFGLLPFVFIFLPLLAIDRYKLQLHKALSEKLKLILGIASAILIGLSVLFKIMHLMGADILLVLGIGLFTLGFLPFLFFRMYKKSLQ